MMSQSREDFFRKIQAYLEDKDKDSKFGKLSYAEQRYIRTHSGVTHSNRRKLDDYLHTTHVAVFLYQLLKQANYFQVKDPSKYENRTK
ncbi:hypothetical protein WDU94_009061 [Cyamophila willieti]